MISRVTEITMAFPVLLFVIALAATVGPRLDTVTFGIFGNGVVTLVLIFSLFGWFYPARIMRAQVLSIREKEFIEAARMIGASDGRIIRSHVLPHLVAPIIVFSTLIVASYILAEAGLSFLGLGINRRSRAGATCSRRGRTTTWPSLADGLARPRGADRRPSRSTCSATASATRSIPAPPGRSGGPKGARRA